MKAAPAGLEPDHDPDAADHLYNTAYPEQRSDSTLHAAEKAEDLLKAVERKHKSRKDPKHGINLVRILLKLFHGGLP
ncbi:MAG: hypothetical protein OEW15_09850 [Nitrospirota bacterium]|nr:hypothetical protein [Nitrospirota bacterium]